MIKEKIQKRLKRNEIYICGHTHWAEVDEKNQYANSGIICGCLGQYLLIDKGKLILKEEWYD